MTAVVESDPLLGVLLCQSIPGSTTLLTGIDELAQQLERDPAEHVVVIGPSVPVEDAVVVAEQHRLLRPTLAVVLVRSTADAGVAARAVGAGVREVVATDDLGGLRRAVRRLHAVSRATGNDDVRPRESDAVPGGLVTVYAGKGGVGKSLVATNLAAALADLGQRVCLIDLGLGGSDVAAMLGFAPQHLADDGRVAAEAGVDAVGEWLIRHSDRLAVLAAPAYVGPPVSHHAVGPVLETLTAMFDVVVVDTSETFDEHALRACDRSDLVVLVGTLDVVSVNHLEVAAAALDMRRSPRDLWRLVVNRADAQVGLPIGAVERTLGIAPALTLPSSRVVRVAVNVGEPIVRWAPRHPVSRSLSSFAESIARDLWLPGSPASPHSPHPWDTGRAHEAS